MDRDPNDPKGLIRESYAIAGITEAECRSIFLDWALSLPAGAEPGPAIAALLERYEAGTDDHPMTAILRDGRAAASRPATRRGGRAGRHGMAETR